MKKNIVFLLLSLLFSYCIAPKAVKKSSIEKPKNILFIAVDDLKPLLNCYGEGQMHTPNFDRLAAKGVAFTNAHVQQALCGPSRASVMTACYPDRTGVWDLHTDFREVSPGLISMPEYLVAQGYQSEAIGKIFHYNSASPNHDGKSWTVAHFAKPDNFQPVYGSPPFAFWAGEKLVTIRDSLFAEATQKGLNEPKKQMEYALKHYKPSTECTAVSDEAYPDGLFANEAVRRLGKFKKSGQPFFLALGFIKPHLPFNAPQKYWDLYKREAIDLAPFRGLAAAAPDLAYHSFGELRSYSDIDSKLDVGIQMPEVKQRELIHGYMACVSYIDAQLGKVLDALEANGLDKNTLIVLWGDHGFHLGDHTIWCKHSNLEQATRIPLIFSGPGIAKNVQTHQPVELIDVFPTLFDLLGLPAPKQVEGISLMPLLDENPKTVLEKDFAISQYPRGKKIMGYSVRTENYRYTEWLKYQNDFSIKNTDTPAETIARELYDYQKDPNEKQNFIENEGYLIIKRDLEAKVQRHLKAK